ncbi:MAG TPA: hypothetical protein VKE40_15895 [Gemmataceae bacterium]|nr:hypothetical protein [Gemmataceae bacterium]
MHPAAAALHFACESKPDDGAPRGLLADWCLSLLAWHAPRLARLAAWLRV